MRTSLPCSKLKVRVPLPSAWATDSMYIRPGEPCISRSMMASTLSSSVCAEAPGKAVAIWIAGGATAGYCWIGSWVSDNAPVAAMKSAITHAKMGRSIKKRDICGPVL